MGGGGKGSEQGGQPARRKESVRSQGITLEMLSNKDGGDTIPCILLHLIQERNRAIIAVGMIMKPMLSEQMFGTPEQVAIATLNVDSVLQLLQKQNFQSRGDGPAYRWQGIPIPNPTDGELQTLGPSSGQDPIEYEYLVRSESVPCPLQRKALDELG